MKVVYLAIIILCLIIISYATYYALGGFQKVEVFVFEGGERTVIGQHYIGKLQPSEIREIVTEKKEMLDRGQLKGKLSIVEYENDTIGSDSSHYFIGASFEEIRNVLEIPSGYTYEEYSTSKIYRVFITQHPWVRPLPSDIRSMMEVRSIEDGEVLAPYTFDIYYEDGSWCTESWVR
jgi:hypothetical protein